ncbi:unnamed protein product [Linum tenue]|uniref:Secreted protein n=1 Tax=Linum tenue TaxID=586396 RepID=A0AAV0L7Q7_9ROSI|nr:unnamed protein product [Linum tenue]
MYFGGMVHKLPDSMLLLASCYCFYLHSNSFVVYIWYLADQLISTASENKFVVHCSPYCNLVLVCSNLKLTSSHSAFCPLLLGLTDRRVGAFGRQTRARSEGHTLVRMVRMRVFHGCCLCGCPLFCLNPLCEK